MTAIHDKPADHLGNALWCTRMIRFGLEVVWEAVDNIPDEVQSDDKSARAALQALNDWLTKIEEGELHDMRIAREYALIRPASLLDPRPPRPWPISPQPSASSANTTSSSPRATSHDHAASNPAPARRPHPGPVHAEEDMPHPIVARLALEVLWQQLYYTARPGELGPEEEAVSNVLHAMHEMLWRKEQEASARTGWFCHHLILRPVNPLNLPTPDEAAEIRAAIATLIRHDLLARPWADEQPT